MVSAPHLSLIYNNWGFLVLIVPGAGIETLSLDLCCYSSFSKQLRVKELILCRTSQMNPVSRYSVCLLSVLTFFPFFSPSPPNFVLGIKPRAFCKLNIPSSWDRALKNFWQDGENSYLLPTFKQNCILSTGLISHLHYYLCQCRMYKYKTSMCTCLIER